MINRRAWLWLLALLAVVGRAPAVEIGLLPPIGDEALAKAVRAAAAEVGITVSVLEPAQLIDPARLSPAIYSMVILLGGEHYPDTVIDEGDAAAGLQAYVDAGGALLVAGSGVALSRPQRWNGSDWRTIPAPVRRVQLATRFGLLDAGQPMETALPKDSSFATSPNAALASRLPERFPVPDAAGTYRPIPGNQDKAVEFTPLATLVDQQGGTFGAGIAQMRRPGEAKGTVFYCWSPLLTGLNGRAILLGLLSCQAQQQLTSDQISRRDELLAQIQLLEKIHRQAQAVLPDSLHSDELDKLRTSLTQQAEQLRWLREACLVGNLNFVALRLQKLRGELVDLPARVGQAVDAEITEQVANPVGTQVVLPLEPPRATAGAPTIANADAGVVMPEAAAAPPLPGEPAGPRVPSDTQRVQPLPTPPRPAPRTSTGSVAGPPAVSVGSGATPAAGAGSAPAAAPLPSSSPRTEPVPVKPRFDTANPVLEFEITGRGKFYVELYPEAAPQTCSAFLYLCRSGFYTGTYFHRRVEHFVVQGGDPVTKTGKPPDDPEVGTGGPDWTVPGEFSKTLHHERGTLGLARDPDPQRPDSGGSQFYICLEPQPTLDGQYAIFGKVIEGLDVIDKLQVGDKIAAVRVVQGADAQNPPGVKPLELFNKK